MLGVHERAKRELLVPFRLRVILRERIGAELLTVIAVINVSSTLLLRSPLSASLWRLLVESESRLRAKRRSSPAGLDYLQHHTYSPKSEMLSEATKEEGIPHVIVSVDHNFSLHVSVLI